MGIKVTGIEPTISTFRAIDRRFTEAAARAVEQGAKELAALARSMAPVDRGDLVRSIRAQRVRTESATAWRVKVGGIQGGRNVSAYAGTVHGALGVTDGNSVMGGSLKPGKKSRAKAKATGVLVGGGYMSRALRLLREDITSDIRKALRSELSEISRYTRKRTRR